MQRCDTHPPTLQGGYLKRLERKAIVKHKWQTRWMRLDSQYLSVYGSAAEASKDKSGKLALQQYRLYDLEEVALARNIHGMVTIPPPLTKVGWVWGGRQAAMAMTVGRQC